MTVLRIDTPILQGYQIFEPDLEIAGLFNYFENFTKFIKGISAHNILFQKEPNNQHDKNAIAIYGTCSSKSFLIFKSKTKVHLGYIPKEVSKNIMDNNLFDFIEPRLRRVWAGQHGNNGIGFDVIIQKNKMKELKKH